MKNFEQEKQVANADPVTYLVKICNTDFSDLPMKLRLGYARWWLFGMLPGSFLRAVINNNLKEAVVKADAQNLSKLHEIVLWFYNNADERTLGHRSRDWAEQGGYFGKLKKTLESKG